MLNALSRYAKRATPKESIAVTAALRDIKDRSQAQNRGVTIQLHPQWRRGSLAHNLAILVCSIIIEKKNLSLVWCPGQNK
jgi:uncharacterized membrane protein